MSAVRTFPIPNDFYGLDDEVKGKREARARDQGLESCTHCGRGVKEGKAFVVVIGGGGAHVVHTADWDRAEMTDTLGFMGAWLIGSTCAKGIPAAFKKRWEGWGE
jgi:hypothetical protein